VAAIYRAEPAHLPAFEFVTMLLSSLHEANPLVDAALAPAQTTRASPVDRARRCSPLREAGWAGEAVAEMPKIAGRLFASGASAPIALTSA